MDGSVKIDNPTRLSHLEIPPDIAPVVRGGPWAKSLIIGRNEKNEHAAIKSDVRQSFSYSIHDGNSAWDWFKPMAKHAFDEWCKEYPGFVPNPEIWHHGQAIKYVTGNYFAAHADHGVFHGDHHRLAMCLLVLNEEYEGGQIVFETVHEFQPQKLIAGDCLVFPSCLIHEVLPITQGERYVLLAYLMSPMTREEWTRFVEAFQHEPEDD